MPDIKAATAKDKGVKGRARKPKAEKKPSRTTTMTTTSTKTTVAATTTSSSSITPSTAERPTTKAKTKRSATSATGTSSTKKPRESIPLALKAEFIREMRAEQEWNPKYPLSAIYSKPKYNFYRQEVSRMVQKTDEIPIKAEEVGPRNAMRINRVYPRRMEVIEKVLNLNIKHEIALRILVNDKRLKEMAVQTYIEMKPFLDPDVTPKAIDFSDGWLAKFKKNYSIHTIMAHGGEGDVDMAKHGPLLKDIARQLSQFDPADIYNCDETGLYLKVLSNRTLPDKAVRGREIIKDARVSILLCCSADGSDKRTPFVFSAYRPQGLRPETEAQLKKDFGGSGYMTQALFKNWLEELDAKMEGRHIALLMNNAPGHGDTDEIDLKNITIFRLPLQSTSVSQPLDAGIIRSFKVKYSRHMIRVITKKRLVTNSEKAKILNGELWQCLVDAWEDVTATTIRNSFARVPTIPAAMQKLLRAPVHDDKDNEMEDLKQELMESYPDRSEAIKRHNDFGVLVFLSCCEGRGPTRQLMDAIKTVSTSEKFKGFFLPAGSVVVVDEDQKDENGNSSDVDYSYSHSRDDLEQRRVTGSRRNMENRLDRHDMGLPPGVSSS